MFGRKKMQRQIGRLEKQIKCGAKNKHNFMFFGRHWGALAPQEWCDTWISYFVCTQCGLKIDRLDKEIPPTERKALQQRGILPKDKRTGKGRK